jgi:hypothetical protein
VPPMVWVVSIPLFRGRVASMNACGYGSPLSRGQPSWASRSYAVSGYSHSSAISPRVSREVCHQFPALSNQRAQGMPGAQCARSRACSVESTRVSHHGHTGITRHSPRNGFNGFLRALPGDRALLPPSPRETLLAKLDASVGASGPHDFAVRVRAVRLRRMRVHRIPRPTSVTTAKRPSCGHGMAGVLKLICPTC